MGHAFTAFLALSRRTAQLSYLFGRSSRQRARQVHHSKFGPGPIVHLSVIMIYQIISANLVPMQDVMFAEGRSNVGEVLGYE